MSTVYDQVKKFAQQIKTEKLKDTVIYVDNQLVVQLIDINELPDKYFKKTDILYVSNPYLYLKGINKRDPTKTELDQFKLIEILPTILPTIKESRYGELIPPELMREHLLSLPLKDILKMKTVSKEYKNIIDNLWCDLIKRDYPKVKYDKNNCYNEYRKIYGMDKYIVLDWVKIKDKITTILRREGSTILIDSEAKRDIEYLQYIFQLNVKKESDIWYVIPKKIFDQNMDYISKYKTMKHGLRIGGVIVPFVYSDRLKIIVKELEEFKIYDIKTDMDKDQREPGITFSFGISRQNMEKLFDIVYGKNSFEKYYKEEFEVFSKDPSRYSRYQRNKKYDI